MPRSHSTWRPTWATGYAPVPSEGPFQPQQRAAGARRHHGGHALQPHRRRRGLRPDHPRDDRADDEHAATDEHRAARGGVAVLRVDGGASANDLAMQFQADVLGVPVVRPACIETTALGAAYLAGLQVGFWPDIDTIAGQWREDVRFTPSMEAARRAESLARWRRAVERSRDWARD